MKCVKMTQRKVKKTLLYKLEEPLHNTNVIFVHIDMIIMAALCV